MRRPVKFIAGLLLVTGASLAFAGPASASASHDSRSASVAHNPFGDDYEYDLDYRSSSYDLDYEDNNDTYNQFSLIPILSPNGQGNTGLGLNLFGGR